MKPSTLFSLAIFRCNLGNSTLMAVSLTAAHHFNHGSIMGAVAVGWGQGGALLYGQGGKSGGGSTM